MELHGEACINDVPVNREKLTNNTVEFQLGDFIIFGNEKSGVKVQFGMSLKERVFNSCLLTVSEWRGCRIKRFEKLETKYDTF